MDKLLNPDIGLTLWTLVTFACVVLVLGKFAWGPILSALEARENQIKSDLSAADEARKAADQSRREFEAKLAEMQDKTRELLSQAERDGRKMRDDMLKAAQDESARLADKTRKELAEEQRRLVQELRSEVVGLSVATAEKLLRKSVDKTVQDKVMQEASADLETWSKQERN
jgi:F-type H+-transporting ATPase subunit b